MGGGRWTDSDWKAYSTAHVAGRSEREIFKSTTLDETLDPARFEWRESRDGPDNPFSTPVILAADVTGSMGMIAHTLMRSDLNKVAGEIEKRNAVRDAHIMVAGIGDSTCDRSPIQATQFEASIALAPQLAKIHVEGGGGGNEGESYSLAHLLAGLKTSTDSWEKRRRKGYLLTIGDEPILARTSAADIRKFLGVTVQSDMTARECLDLAQRSYEVFHVVICEGNGFRSRPDMVKKTWEALLPQRVLYLKDHTKLGETIVSAIQVIEGASVDDVARSWSGTTALTVASAIGSLAPRGASGGVRRL